MPCTRLLCLAKQYRTALRSLMVPVLNELLSLSEFSSFNVPCFVPTMYPLLLKEDEQNVVQLMKGVINTIFIDENCTSNNIEFLKWPQFYME